MGQAQLYLLDTVTNKWRPATSDDLSGGGGNGATAQNQLDNINRLETLSNLVATKSDQDEIDALLAQINATTEDFRTVLLAENATEVKQDEIIARLGNAAIDANLPDLRSLVKSLVDRFLPIAWGNPIQGSVGNSNKELLSEIATRRHVLLCNLDNVNHIYLNVDIPASPTSAIFIVQPGQTIVLKDRGKKQINIAALTETIAYTYQIGT